MSLAEVRGQAVALDPVQFEVRRIHAGQHGARIGQRARCREVGMAGIAIAQCRRVVLGHLGMADGPAALGHVVTPLEVDRVVGHAAPAPQAGGAAEAKPTVLRRRCMGLVGVAFIGVGALRRAAVQQDDIDAAAIQLAGQGDARGTGADDAHLCSQQAAGFDVAGFGLHGLSPCRAAAASLNCCRFSAKWSARVVPISTARTAGMPSSSRSAAGVPPGRRAPSRA